MSEFRKYPSIPRYRKDIVITEKIDGTNSCVSIQPLHNEDGTLNLAVKDAPVADIIENEAGQPVHVYAQSRSRVITPEQDNHGFARWVRDNQHALYEALGPGFHYGEWWGGSINRGYGLPKTEKHFTLFNPARYELSEVPEQLLTVVPVLYTGPAYLPYLPADSQTRDAVEYAMQRLARTGSRVRFAEGYDNPEGVVITHTASKHLYKVTYEYDEGKWTKK